MLAASGAASMSLVFGAPTSAVAAGRDGVCDRYEVCFYYLTNRQGSMADFHADTQFWPDLSRYTFVSPGAGQGQRVDNNTRSVCNRATGEAVLLYDGYHFFGDTLILLKPYGDLRCHMDLGQFGFNDRISSFELYVRS